MTRLYIQPSFLNSCEEHGLWSGGNDQYRGDKSVDFSTFTKSGRARVEAFSDAALEANKEKRKTSVSLKDRILPQARRVSTLTSQLVELEQAYKSGEYDINEYSTLRAVLVVKRNRAQELYKKAISVQEPTYEDDLESSQNRPFFGNSSYFSRPTPTSESAPSLDISTPKDTRYSQNDIPTWIAELSPENSLKKPLKIACKVVRGLIRFSSATKRYINELKEV